MKNKLLSIITINYNDAVGLKKTMDSIINQTWDGFEYIVIDGGSLDGSSELIASYKEKVDYWVSEKDNGIYNAMNKGILKSKGKYLLFINSGDVLIKDTVLENVQNFLLADVDFLCGHLSFEKEGKEVVKEHPEQMSFSYLTSKTIYHPSTFIKRTLFDKYGFYNENHKIVSDWEFFFKALGLNGATYQKLPYTITHFDMNGISSNQGDKVRHEKQEVFKHYLPYVFNNEKDSYIFDKFRETNKRFRLLQQIDKSPFFRKITTFQLSVTMLLMKLLRIRK